MKQLLASPRCAQIILGAAGGVYLLSGFALLFVPNWFIEFPFVMGCPLWLEDRWGGQRTQLLIATCQFLGLEQCRDAGAAWQGLVFPARINS